MAEMAERDRLEMVTSMYQWFAECIPIAPGVERRLARYDPKCGKSRTKSTSWVKGSRDRWATLG